MSEFEDRVRRDLHRSAEAVEPPPLLWRRVEDRLGGRDRRPIAILAAAAAVVVAVAILAVALHGGGSTKHVASVSPETTEPQGIVTPAEETTTTESTATTTAMRTSTTRATTTTKPPAPTTTTLPPYCNPEDIEYKTKTDKASYSAGEAVTITETAQNISRRPCTHGYKNCWWADVYDSAGQRVWSSSGNGTGLSCNTSLTLQTLKPGEYSHESMTQTWDQRTCPPASATTTTSTPASWAPCSGPQAPTGQYVAFGWWGASRSSDAASSSPAFQLS